MIAEVTGLSEAIESRRRTILQLPFNPALNPVDSKRSYVITRLLTPKEITQSKGLRLAVSEQLGSLQMPARHTAEDTRCLLWKILETVYSLEAQFHLTNGRKTSNVLRHQDIPELVKFYLHRLDLSKADLLRIKLALRPDKIGTIARLANMIGL